MLEHPAEEAELAKRVAEVVRELEEVEISDGAFKRLIWIRPEFTCEHGCVKGREDCYPGSGGYHGIGSRQIYFGVAVPGMGGVSANLHTNIYPDGVEVPSVLLGHVLGSVDVHYPRPPEYLAEFAPLNKCRLTGGNCWSDGTALQAIQTAQVLVSGGVEAVWAWLAEGWLPRLAEAN